MSIIYVDNGDSVLEKTNWSRIFDVMLNKVGIMRFKE